MKTSLILLFSLFIHGCFAQEVPVPAPSKEPKSETRVVEFPDRDAEFPGGVLAMKKWIQENTQYPSESIVNKEEGKVYVAFIVGADGNISQVVIERGVSHSLDREAMRLVSSMPNWTPGEQNGRNVSTRMRLPILFSL